MNKIELLHLVNKIASTKGAVTVIGDVILDVFTTGYRERISSEAPVPIIHVTEQQKMLGGAGNVAANVATLGGLVKLISVIGSGHSGRELIELLENLGISTSGLVIDQKRLTTKKERLLSGDEQIVCMATETREQIAPWVVQKISETIEANGSSTLVITDYDRGMITEELVRRVIEAAVKQNKKIIADLHVRNGFDVSCYGGAYLLTPNRHEAAKLINSSPINGDNETQEVATKLVKLYNTNVLVTRDQEGMTLVTREGQVIHIPVVEPKALCVSGAGDTVVGTIALALASGVELIDAVRLSAYAAAVVVNKPGTATVSLAELKTAIEIER